MAVEPTDHTMVWPCHPRLRLALSIGPYVKSQNMGTMTRNFPSYPTAATRKQCDRSLVTTSNVNVFHHLTVIVITVTEVGRWVACPLCTQPPVWQ